MLVRFGIVATLVVAATGGMASAQDDARARPPGGAPYATLYRDTNYSGPAVAVERPQPDPRLGFAIRSIRIRSGAWQLCSVRNYAGTCITVTASTPDLGSRLGILRRVGSIRPIAVRPPEPPVGSRQSLRGMGAEFFPAPSNRNSGRVQSCSDGGSTANCAARTADQFCRAAGWGGSAYQSQQTEGRRVYLADVLCVRSGF